VNIVLVGPTYPYRGGIAHHTALLARHLGARHRVRLLTFSRQYPEWLFPGRTDRDPSRDVVAAAAEAVLAPLAPWTWWRAARLAAAADPDLVLIQWWVPFWAPSLAAVAALVRRWTRARVVFICHNVLPHDSRAWLARPLARLALGRGDAFIVHAAPDAAALRALLPRAAAADIHHATLPAFDIARPAGRAEARSRLGLPPGAAVALFFGFVRPYKGLDHLIDALPAAAALVPDLRLVVAGEFWQPAADFLARAAAVGMADRVRIDDRYIPNEEVGVYFDAADVLVMPYVEATQSAVATLAAAFGLPAIATRVGGLPEVVIDGETGLVVPPGDPAALAEALARILRDEAFRMRLRSGASAQGDRFGWGRLVALIESLPPSHPPPRAAVAGGAVSVPTNRRA